MMPVRLWRSSASSCAPPAPSWLWHGRAVAGKAQGFGLKMIVYDPWVAAEAVAAFGTRTDDLDALLRESDYVSIHVPLTEATRNLINARTLRLMKPSAYLINTSRGPI